MRGLKFLGLYAVAGILAWFGVQAHGDTIQQSYNIGNPVVVSTHTYADVGWTIVASGSYQLTGVDTLFNDFQSDGGEGDPRTMTLEVYSAAPPDGGTLLRSATFNTVAGTLGGVYGLVASVNFAPLQLTSGEDYFIGFRNVQGYGINVANPGSSVSTARVDFTGDGSYSGIPVSSGVSTRAILQLRGVDGAAVPLPGAAVGGLALMGVLALVQRGRRSATAG